MAPGAAGGGLAPSALCRREEEEDGVSSRYYIRLNEAIYRWEIVDKHDSSVVAEWKVRRKASKECQILNGTYKGDGVR